MDEFLFDLEEWRKRLPLESSKYVDGCGPRSIVRLEELRAMVAARYDLGPSVPTDIFAFALGEPPRRDVTKVGGAPYRPADVPWPETKDEGRMIFLAQYRFAESRDHIGELPGDVLLVFIKSEIFYEGLRRENMYFEWYPLGIEDLVVDEDLWLEPGGPFWTCVECYGVRHRTVDYVEDVPVEVLQGAGLGDAFGGYPLELAASEFSRVLGMKIGGLPLRNPLTRQGPDEDLPGRFLCSLTTIVPRPNLSYPWLNRAEPLDSRTVLSREMSLNFLDGFLLNFSIDENDQMCWSIDYG